MNPIAMGARRWMARVFVVALLVLWTSARHEGSHALAAMWEGATLDELRIWPGIDPELGFYFGFVRHSGETGWITDAAPFVAAGLMLTLGYLLARFAPSHTRRAQAVVLLGVASPLADLAYNYQGGLWRSGTDVYDLFGRLPDLPIHLFFLSALGLGGFALWDLRRRGKLAAPTYEGLR